MTYETQINSDKLEVHYTSLFESLPGSCILLKNDAPHFTILASTPEYLAQTGTTKDSIIGKGIFEAFPGNPSDSTDTGTSNLRASLEYVLSQKKPHHLPTQRYDVAGENGSFSERYWRASNKPVFSAGLEVAYIIHSAEDITPEVMVAEIEKQMKGLEESEQDLRSLVLQAPIGICVMDAPSLVTRIANNSFAEIAGRSLDEIVGFMYWDTFVEARPYYEDALNKVVQQGVTFRANEVEVPLIRHGKKEIVNVNFVYEPVKDSRGNVKKVVVWVVDNTTQVVSRKKVEESELYFRQLTDTVPVIIWITKPDGSCSYLNQHWYDYTGQTSEEAEGFGWLSATHPDDKDAAGKIFMDANEKQKPFSLLYRLRSKDGDYRWCKDSGSPKFSTDGVFEGFVGTVVDVHEEKIAEEKLRESEERFRSMADASPVMIWTLDKDGNSTYYNTRAREFTGYNEVDLHAGKSWQVAIHPDDIAMANSVVGNAVGQRIPYQMECRMMRADGEWRWLLSHGTPRFGNKGEYFGFVGSSIDITERKNTEQALEESESRFRNVISTTPVGTAILTGPEMKIEVANDVITRFWQRDHTVIGKPLTEAIPELIGQPFPGFLAEVYDTGVTHIDNAALAYFVNGEGKLVPAYFNYSYTALRETSGTIYGVLIMAIDVTEEVLSKKRLEESESRFRSLADQSPMFVFLIEADPSAPVNYWNKTWLEYTGQSFDEARGRAWEGIIHPDDIPLVMAIYTTAFKNQQPYFIPAIRTKRYDGVYRWHAFKGNPRYLADGNFTGYVGVGFDVHEQKVTEERLEALVTERTKELQRSNEDLLHVSHVASHDLKEPMRKVKIFISRLEQHLDGRLDETGIRYIEKIHSAADRMFTMIDGVLTYSTINNLTQKPQPVDLNEVMKNIETDLEVLIQKTGAQFTYSGLPVIEGAPVLFYQLFYNLVNNAIKFGEAGVAPQIKITSEILMDDNRQFARLTLSDNGIGFEDGHAKMIFDAFTRLNSKDEFEGTGLGLALCKKIIERHGGSISASGVPGKGATFTIVLPVQQNEQHI